MEEIWKPIEGFEGYEISNKGRVKSQERKRKANKGSFRMVREKIISNHIGKNGYIQVCLCKDNIKKYPLLHRLVSIHYIENPFNKPCVNHIDGNKANNSVENLEWCDYSDNIKHAIENNLYETAKGESKPNSKLSSDIVRIIKNKLINGTRVCDIAREFGVHSVTITDIKMGRTWKHI